jgi:hypothetical protein
MSIPTAVSLIATAGSHSGERAEESIAVGESLLNSVIISLAAMVVSEPRTTAVADAGVAHLHGKRFDVSYVGVRTPLPCAPRSGWRGSGAGQPLRSMRRRARLTTLASARDRRSSWR